MTHRFHAVVLLTIGITLAVACATVDTARYERPDGVARFQGDRAELISLGESLWNDTALGATGLACQSCHMNDAQFKDSFREPYPHYVAMPNKRAGLSEVTAEQMIQFCVTMPLGAEPLPWEGKELAALTAYVEAVVQPRFAKAQGE